MSSAADLEDFRLLKKVAREAGELALTYFEQASLNTWDKSKGHPVTEADIAVNTLIQMRLMQERPAYGWLSEESAITLETRQSRRTWIVDPIDGTKAFIKGEPYWCVGLGLLVEGQARAGVVYAPVLRETYAACSGQGATLNKKPLHVSDCQTLAGAGMIAYQKMFQHPDWPEPWPDLRYPKPRPNATLLRLCWVARGDWDATLALTRKSDWDIAPAAIIVEEAGGIATTHLGEAFVFNRDEPAQRSLLAAGNRLHSLLRDRVKGVRLPDPNWAVRPEEKTDTEPTAMAETKQLLHLVIGGKLKDVTDVEFEDLSQIDFVGAFPDYKAAYDAWKSAAQRTVDNAEIRYFILHAHKLLDPETGDHHHV